MITTSRLGFSVNAREFRLRRDEINRRIRLLPRQAQGDLAIILAAGLAAAVGVDVVDVLIRDMEESK